jgi:hypothetical protein
LFLDTDKIEMWMLVGLQLNITEIALNRGSTPHNLKLVGQNNAVLAIM